MGSGKVKRKYKASLGQRKTQRMFQVIRRLRMKIARWENNKLDETKVSKWKSYQKVRKRPRHNNWDTSGLTKHLKLLESLL